MADHVVCISVRIKNHNNNLDNLISKRIRRFNHKLTLEDICNEVLGDSELDPLVNKAQDRWVFNLRVKKKKIPTDLPIPEKQGRVRGNKNIFKVGLDDNGLSTIYCDFIFKPPCCCQLIDVLRSKNG